MRRLSECTLMQDFFFLADISYRPTVQVSSGKIIFVTNVLAGGVK